MTRKLRIALAVAVTCLLGIGAGTASAKPTQDCRWLMKAGAQKSCPGKPSRPAASPAPRKLLTPAPPAGHDDYTCWIQVQLLQSFQQVC